MKPYIVSLVLFSALCASQRAVACSGQPLLSMEIKASEIADSRFIESTQIYPDGCVISKFSEIDIRSGVYTRYVGSAAMTLFESLSHDALLLASQLDASRSKSRAHMSGGDIDFGSTDPDLFSITIANNGNKILLEFDSEDLLLVDKTSSKADALGVGIELLKTIRNHSANPLTHQVRKLK